METSYTSDINLSNHEIEHTSLLENGFMPVRTAQEVPVQEQSKGKSI